MNNQSKEKWHVSDDGTPGKCFADVRSCPNGQNGPHFKSENDVYEFFRNEHESKSMRGARKVDLINDDEIYDSSDDGVHEDNGPEEAVRYR